MGETTNGTLQLAEFVAGLRLGDLPDDVVNHCRRSTLDTLGVALGALGQPSVTIVETVLDDLGGNPQATVWGDGRRTSTAHGAFANGFMAHVLDFDDSYVPDVTVLHANAAVVPAALAIAEARDLSGGDYVVGYVVGYETAARMALAAGAPLYGHLHVTALVGGFGAAAAVGKLLGLDAPQLVNAFGLANAQAGASSQVLGTMTKAFHAGRAALSGVYAGLLAGEGLTSAADALTGHGGFHESFPSDRDYEALLGDLGTRWEIRRTGFKPYACGVVQHALLDGVIQLRNAHDLEPGDVESIEGRVTRYVLRATGRTDPKDELEAKFSAYHAAAVVLADGVAGPAQYDDERVNDPEIRDLRARVQLVADESLAADEAHVRIVLRDGRVVERHVDHAIGSADNQMTDEMVEAKFRMLAAPVLGDELTQSVIDRVWRIEELGSMRELAAGLAPTSPTRGEVER